MKFAKQLQQEMREEWNGRYVDYKLMKKVLKLQDGVLPMFSEALVSQLIKVHYFMQQEQATLSQSISFLEGFQNGKALAKLEGSPHVSMDGFCHHCEWLLQRIATFRSYAALNQTAVRKIIKKFDKRFHARFCETFVVPYEAKLWASEEDIGMWLLSPAQRCVELVKTLLKTSDHGQRAPVPRQFDFWVEELQIGAEMLRHRVGGTMSMGPTWLRLKRHEVEDLAWSVRNTFIQCAPTQIASRARASSQPVRRPLLRRAEDEAHHPGTPVGHRPSEPSASDDSACEHVSDYSDDGGQQARRLFVGSSACPVEAARMVTVQVAHASSNGRAARNVAKPQATVRRGQRPSQVLTPTSAGLGCSGSTQKPDSPAELQNCLPTTPERHAYSEGCTPYKGSEWQGDRNAVDAPPASRWWNEVTEICPLSGFPVHLLPYPPFKFHVQLKGTSEVAQLIDGPFLVLKVLTTWRFEAFGRPLTSVDIKAIDAYMKRCKLGPFRLGRAIELLGQDTPEARQELEELRARAYRKLECLKQIQRKRLTRGDRRPGCLGQAQQRRG